MKIGWPTNLAESLIFPVFAFFIFFFFFPPSFGISNPRNVRRGWNTANREVRFREVKKPDSIGPARETREYAVAFYCIGSRGDRNIGPDRSSLRRVIKISQKKKKKKKKKKRETIRFERAASG